MQKTVLSLIFAGVCSLTCAQSLNNETPMQKALQKELREIYLNDANEFIDESIKNGDFYPSPQSPRYQAILNSICKDNPTDTCPYLYSSRKKRDVASMQPNGALVIYEPIIDKLSDNETTFILSHEFGHLKFQHNKNLSHAIAKSVVENNIILMDPERAIPIAFMLPGVKDVYYASESQADLFGSQYLKKNNISINCLDMFTKIAGGEEVYTEFHDTISVRCDRMKNI